MGQSGSREGQILYAAVIGNTSAIRELVSRGTSVNCVDSQGRTPLILASGQAEGFEAAKLLLQMGALVRAYSKGPGGGMAIHYAARKKLDAMVKLLLDHGADPLFPNDDRKTALDLARERNETSVVRLIESRVALFEGYVRQQTLSALSLVKEFRIWVAVLPGPTMSDGRQTFRLALYRSMAFGVPYFNIALHVCRIHMTKLDSANPVLVIEDPVHGNNGKLKLVSDLDSPDPLQIFRLHDACRGTPRAQQQLGGSGAAGAGPVAAAGAGGGASGSRRGGQQSGEEFRRVVNVHAWQDDVDEDTAFQLALSESMRTASIASSARADAPGASGSTSTAAQGMSRGEEGADGFILTYSSSEPQPRSGRSLSSSSSAAAAVPFTALHRSSRSVSASADRHPFVPPAAPIPSSSAAAGTSSGVAAGPAAGTAAGSASTAGTAGFAAAGAEGGRMRDEIANQFSSVAPALNRAPAAAVSSLFASGPPSAPPVDAPASAAAGPHSSTPAAPAAAPAGAGAGTGAGAGAGEEAGAAATGAEVGAEAKAGVATTVGAPSSSSAAAAAAAAAGASKEGRCVICWDSAALSVCVPCGHVAGCVECLTKVRSKGWGCPVCRAPIREVVKIFHV